MKKELNVLFTAFTFFTRLPMPGNLTYSEQIQSRAFRYFPLAGLVVGAVGAAVFVLAGMLISPLPALILALISMMILTGCLHEDGVADFFDAFGGSHSRERTLAIMKDSHIGTYGVCALNLLILLKIALLYEINPEQIPVVLIASCAFGRVTPILLVNSSTYARAEESKGSFARHKIDRFTVAIALLFGLAPLLLFPWKFTVALIILSSLFFLAFRHLIHKRIGGFTGDILGALEQFTEVIFLLTYAAL